MLRPPRQGRPTKTKKEIVVSAAVDQITTPLVLTVVLRPEDPTFSTEQGIVQIAPHTSASPATGYALEDATWEDAEWR